MENGDNKILKMHSRPIEGTILILINGIGQEAVELTSSLYKNQLISKPTWSTICQNRDI